MNTIKILLYSLLAFSLLSVDTRSEIIPDETLGTESSIVIPQNQSDVIEGGAVRENNLFHSFKDFSIGNGQQVYFANPDNITNILTRITGNNPSEVLGTLGVEGAANLFLLNPNGIVFGDNASLDINGSFLATTADSFILENGVPYSAVNPEIPPLLTINMPVGLQFDSNPAAIEVQGTGSNLFLSPVTFEFLLRDVLRTKGLEVSGGKTLGLIGGEIKLTGGNLTALEGNVELGSINEAGNVNLNFTETGFIVDYQNITDFGDISLSNSASIDVSGNGGGDIYLQGKNINILNNSAVISSTLGSENGGTVKISASNTLKFIGEEFTEESRVFTPSGIFNQVEASATGNGSNLNIEAGKLEMSQNAIISSSLSGTGDGGAIDIRTEELILNSGEASNTSSLSFYPTGILSLVNLVESSKGKSSDINIEADNIKLINGSLIATATFNAGNSGDISIQADKLEISGTGVLPSLLGDNSSFPSGIFTTVATDSIAGNGGDIAIDVYNLTIADGGQIRSGTLGLGDSGDISIQAEEISINGTSLFLEANVASGIFASSGQGILSGDIQQNTGDGGNVSIITDDLRLTGGGQIGTGTSSTGNSGDLTVKAQEIEIIGQSSTNSDVALTGFADTSGFFTSVARADALGNGGNILVNAGNLQITHGGAIAANVFGAGTGGDIEIDVDSLSVSNSFMVSGIRSGITTTVEDTGIGDAGTISINADNLNLDSGGSVAASAIGNGNAGDINLQGINLSLQGISPEGNLKSQIAAFSQSDSDAGNVDILMQNVTLNDRAIISVSNLGNGGSGNLNLNSQNLSLDRGATLEAKVNIGSQGNINLTTSNIFLRDESQINSQATGTATGGNIFIVNQDNLVLLESSQILADAVQGDGGNINISTQGLFVSPDSLITASSQFGLNGTVEIDILSARIEESIDTRNYEFIAIDNIISNRCFSSPAPQQSSFTYIGRGGIPVNPETRIDEDYAEVNLTGAQDFNSKIVEANAISYSDRGELQLVKIVSLSNSINSLDLKSNNRFCQSN